MRLLPRLWGSYLSRAGVGLAAVALFLSPLPVRASSIHFSVNGQGVDLAASAVDVRAAALAAGKPLRAGLMRSLGTGDALTAGVIEPKIWRNGAPARPTDRVKTGDRLRVINGEDYIEPSDPVVQPIPVPGFPDVEFQIWHGGTPGRVARQLGRYSRQTTNDQVLEAAVPPAVVNGPEVLLTFDDGPDPRWTPMVLSILQAKGVKAVFCVVGGPMARHPELVKRVHDEGHVLCDHTVHHDMRMSVKPDAYVAGEIQDPFNTIKSITGAPPQFYRGPGGNLSPFIIGEAHRLGMRVLGWTVDTTDYRKPGPAVIQNRVIANVHGGGVVLMHDGGGDRSQTVAQLSGLIDRLRAAGYSLVVP